MKKACCFADSRPEKLSSRFREGSPDCEKLQQWIQLQLEQLIRRHGVTHFITGMGRGISTYAAEAVLRLRQTLPISLECVIPYEAQATNWTEQERDRYFDIISKADAETLLQRNYTPDVLHQRNRYMVNHSSYLLAVWAGERGNAANIIHYARQRNRSIIYIDPLQWKTTAFNDGINKVHPFRRGQP